MTDKENHHYFKKYVHEHPKDKFAWYLLGKEYAEKGQLGKAAYCYAKSEEIYEAYETDTSQAALQMRKVVREARQSTQRKKRSWRALGVALLLLLLLLIPTDVWDQDNAWLAEQARLKSKQEQGISSTNIAFYYMNKLDQAGGMKEAVEFMLGTTGSAHRVLLAVERSKDQKWQLWQSASKPFLSVQNTEQSSQAIIRYYDAAACNCEPDDPTPYRASIMKWQKEQEEELVLLSAMTAFEQKLGKKPQLIEQLTAPYPNNVLSGVTPRMRQLFDAKLKAEQAKKAEGAQVQVNTSTGIQDPTQEPLQQKQYMQSQHPLQQPLEIVIDKTNYRLAVVSGEVMIRSYPIGLGADRTPEGTFEISEKVRNPNGKSNGEFGSRGMTLSDTLYAIHGTNKPDSIGKDESLGCIRMRKEDVEELFDMVPLLTKVTIGNNVLPPPAGSKGQEEQPGSKPPVFKLPPQAKEENPRKVYKWLN
ncbi:L,D-transpeptidase [Paenibacillus sp. N1-5-1-14]|uniref:L,D-transpeptidase n=1 Tax=Paenibacillus radicibacter TaxID=2972488 RepID=UPI002158F297|nr:L,D-transpeptidase [Paenibacillus radicibacter]MCR8643904.1 L,D-transpeptidase [Paenibacillus radicibacter]